jgi:ribonuclease BN (tRNA processing enzyme)
VGTAAPREDHFDNLIQLATGADVLVHEAMYLPGIDRITARVPNTTRLKEHILASHTSVEDAGRIAQAAGVKRLVLSHLIPADDPTITDEMCISAARVHFSRPRDRRQGSARNMSIGFSL